MTVRERTAASRGRGFAPLRDLPAIGWLFAAILAAALHPILPAPRWLLIHLVLLGAVSHSILVWSQYFADTLLHTAVTPGALSRQKVRLILLNAGAALVVIGVLVGGPPVAVVGASAVALAAGWHAASLYRQMRGALSARFRMIVVYYVAAAAMLPLGALLGTLMVTGAGDDGSGRILVAHVITNVLGWVGITVAGTVITLWPTMLRTRLVDGAEQAGRRALPLLAGGVLGSGAMCVVGLRIGAAAGVTAYLVGLSVLALPFVRTLRTKHPTDVATWSVLAGLCWFAGVVAFLAIDLFTAGSWEVSYERLVWVTPALAAGFAAQMLIGAMSYLLPVALGGGPRVSRATNASMRRAGPLRVGLVNAGLALALLPTPPLVTSLGWVMVGLGLAAFLVLVIGTSRVARRAKAAAADPATPAGASAARPNPVNSTAHSTVNSTGERTRASAVIGVAVAALAVAVGVAAGPTPASTEAGAAAMVMPTGSTTTISVTAQGMRFSPERVEVPVGNRLVITVHNADPTTTHDLVLESGASTGLIAPGATGQAEVDVVAEDIQGWCSLPGHRQMGMVFQVVVTGVAPGDHQHDDEAMTDPAMTDPARAGDAGAAGLIDLTRSPDDAFSAYPPRLAPAPSGTVHRLTLTAQEVVREVAPGVTQLMWAYNGTVPGPILHGRIGDRFEITLRNDTTMGHSIDFHAGQVAPDEVMRTIPPGETLEYAFTADHAGIWMYHCSTMPMSVHIANGMFGAVIIDPPALEPVDRDYVLVQSELYLGTQGGPVDADKVVAERPDLVVFNGYANQYDHQPLAAKVGERVRIWVLDVGPTRATSFHIVGGQFDTVYAEGAYLLHPGDGASQALGLQAAQGGFVELTFGEPGNYPFVSHVMVDAERGAHGLIAVTG